MLECGGPPVKLAEVHAGEFGDVLSVDKEMKSLAVEALSVAFGALNLGEELFAPVACGRSGIVIALHLQILHQTLVGQEVVVH